MSDLSRVEQLLRNALGEDIYEVTPQSRVEILLAQLNELIEGISASVDPEELTPIVTAWLAENIHDGAVVDTSLSVAGAAAESKKTGEEISQLKEDLNYTKRYDVADIDVLRSEGTVTILPVYVNRAVSSSTGNLGNTSSIRVTNENLIYIPKGATIQITQTADIATLVVHKYDIGQNYLGYSAVSGIDSDTRYIRIVAVHSDSSDITPAQVSSAVTIKLNMQTAHEELTETIAEVNENINNGFVTKHIGKNLLNTSDVVVGYLKSDGDISSTATQYRTSNYLPISSGQTVRISPRTRIFAFYDADKSMVSGSYMNTETENYTATASVDGYFRFSYYVEDIYIQATYGSSAVSYAPYQNYIEDNIKINNFESLSGVVFGDSIMHGAGNPSDDDSDGYIGIGDILNEKYGMSLADYCVSGACVEYVEGRTTKTVYQQILDAIDDGIDPDLIIMDGLSNDIVVGTLGTLGDSFDYVTNGYNDFTYALEYCFGTLRTNFPNVPILYVIPHSSVGRTYTTELQFGDRAREVCKKWSVPIADIYKDGNLNSHIPQQLQAFTNYPSETTGTHPNRDGYDYAYIPLIMSWIKSVFTEIE